MARSLSTKVVLLFLLCHHQCVWAAPSNAVVVEGNSTETFAVDGVIASQQDAEAEVDGPVKYDGAQVWRLPFDNQYRKNVVVDLQNNFG